MKKTNRSFLLVFSVLLLAMTTVHCAGLNGNGSQPLKCGQGYIYLTAENACVPEGQFCDPECSTDQKCEKQGEKSVCVSREPKDKEQFGCSIICASDEFCEKGKCVPSIACSPSCTAGFVCKLGRCIRNKECNPPCSQLGYLCDEGVCKKLCVPDCTGGKSCIRGVCQKACKPACSSGSFCKNGSCAKLEDKDRDGVQSDVDCDDNDKSVFPGGKETCDGKDNDCDGKRDNIDTKACYTGPAGTLNRGICSAGVSACGCSKDSDCSSIKGTTCHNGSCSSKKTCKTSKECSSEETCIDDLCVCQGCGEVELCVGVTLPKKETCDKTDEDCDGRVDNDCKQFGVALFLPPEIPSL